MHGTDGQTDDGVQSVTEPPPPPAV